MKVLITDDTLDSLLSIKISSDGGNNYTDYNVSSLKDNGITFDCSPNDLKVICDANVLKYIQVLADGEKSTSNVDLSDYLKYRDIYFDVYKNPYYGVTLTDEEEGSLSSINYYFYRYRNNELYFSSKNFEIFTLEEMDLVDLSTNTIFGGGYLLNNSVYSNDDYNICFPHPNIQIKMDNPYYVYRNVSRPYLGSETFQTNVRVHFIKHF